MLKKIINKLKAKDSNGKVAGRVSKSAGLPYWEKAVLLSKPSKIKGKGTTASIDTNYVFVPLVPEGSKEIEGAIACKVVGDSVTANFLYERDYENYGFSSANATNAQNLVTLMMYLQNRAFGTESFVLYDKRLLLNGRDTFNKSGTELVSFQPVNTQTDENISGRLNAKYETLEICIIHGHYGCPLTSHQGQLCTDTWRYYTTQSCNNFLVWVDDGGGSGSSGGSGGSSGGGSTGGGGGGGSYTGSTSTVQYLYQQLELNDAEVAFLDTHPFASEETYNYITTNDGILTSQEMKRLAQSHFGYMMFNYSYLDYCQIRYDEIAQNPRSRKIPWFHYLGINVTDPDLYTLIQNLKLHAQQAYYIMGNPSLKIKIENYLSSSNGQTIEEKTLAVTEHVNALESSQEYRDFVIDYETTTNSNEMWWGNDDWVETNILTDIEGCFPTPCDLKILNPPEKESHKIH